MRRIYKRAYYFTWDCQKRVNILPKKCSSMTWIRSHSKRESWLGPAQNNLEDENREGYDTVECGYSKEFINETTNKLRTKLTKDNSEPPDQILSIFQLEMFTNDNNTSHTALNTVKQNVQKPITISGA